MDPLGAPSQFVDVDSLPGWTDAYEAKQLDSHQNPVEKAQADVRSPFPYRKDINVKIILWKGDVALLNCTAIVNTSNESLTDKNPVSESIFMHAGPDLRDELQKLKGCRTGEAKLTKGFNLAARFIIHTVGPKYKSRYRTAAESSLYSCYRNVLQLAKEQAMCSVGFCVINSLKRCYPLEDATHIALQVVSKDPWESVLELAIFNILIDTLQKMLNREGCMLLDKILLDQRICLDAFFLGNMTGKHLKNLTCVKIIAAQGPRTVRRFLEIHGDTLEKVVFAVSDLEEATYQKLLPLYFPRSLEEEIQSLPFLPADIGNAEGEPVVPERQIRITEKPGVPDDASDEEGLEADLSFIGSHAFARMEGDVDKQRRLILQGQLSEAALQKQHQRNYNRWLCQARAEDLSDIASLKALYQTGVDNCGRTVMVVVGRNIPVTLIDMEKALLYFIHVMDHIAVKEYVLVYFHTLTNDYNQLDSNFLKKLYDVVDTKYKRNLKALYFVHPTFRSKVSALVTCEELASLLLLKRNCTCDEIAALAAAIFQAGSDSSSVSAWFFTTFTVSGLKDKIHYVESLQQLFTAIPPEQIDLPPFVLEYDARENGPYYSSYPPSPDL